MQSHNILLLGSGGRECALAWKLRQSPLCNKLFIAPGNAGTLSFGTNLSFAPTDFEAVKQVCLQHQISIVLPGSEDPLVGGIWDYFQMDPDLQHIFVAGPSEAGAQLEGSKAFAKQFMMRHHIPTASYREFNVQNFDAGVDYIRQHPLPIVLKADGLAAGKGVVICTSAEEAIAHFTAMIRDEQFGAASSRVVVEAFLPGIELSVFVLTDGTHYALLPEAKDYKRIGEGDTGPNTGGMGAISPVPFADDAFMYKVRKRIIEPTINGLQREQIPYQGFIFFGLISVAGDPYVIEYNCRMGDPETEVVIPRLTNDLVELLLMMKAKRLHDVHIQHAPQHASTVMLVSGGYPGSYPKGHIIEGVQALQNRLIFHAGTTIKDHKLVTNGGRVLALTSMADQLDEALAASYNMAEQIDFEGKYYRRDIGWEFRGKG